MKSFFIAILLLCFGNSQSARILLMPIYHYSHVNFFTVVGTALKNDGHEIHMVTAETYQKKLDKAGFNYTLYVLPEVRHKL